MYVFIYLFINAAIEGSEVVYRQFVDISVAVAAPSGLLVPVVRDCHAKTWHQLEQVRGKQLASYRAS